MVLPEPCIHGPCFSELECSGVGFCRERLKFIVPEGRGVPSHAQIKKLREEVRKSLKGRKEGNCNRTACQKPGATWYNKGTRAYYCKACAVRINRACADAGEGLICFPPDGLQFRD